MRETKYASRPRWVSLLVLALALFLPAVAGCGGGEEDAATDEPAATETAEAPEAGDTGAGEGDPAAGKQVFAEAGCGNCHTFEAAGAMGTTGPNLDEADTSYDDAVEQVSNGGGGMPAFGDQLSEQEIADVATFVSDD